MSFGKTAARIPATINNATPAATAAPAKNKIIYNYAV